MDFEYVGKLFVKAVGLVFYILFQALQFVILFCMSVALARAFVLLVIWATYGRQLSPQYEELFILGFLLGLRQNFILSNLDQLMVKRVSKWFGIAQADLRFWEGVFEVQVLICTQIILGPILRDSHCTAPTTFENGPLTTFPLDSRREHVLVYSIFLAIVVSISSGRTGCSGICRNAGGETGCLCRRPPNSLGYTSISYKSILTFLLMLIPNIALAVAYALFLNGFYSVGCVVGLDPLLTYYWLIFAAVLIGFGAAAIENRKPFPKPNIKPPHYAFVNNLKAQSYVLHYIILPALIFPLYGDKTDDEMNADNDNFRAFAILSSLHMVLQIKLVIALLRLALEIQKQRARLSGPAPTDQQNRLDQNNNNPVVGQIDCHNQIPEAITAGDQLNSAMTTADIIRRPSTVVSPRVTGLGNIGSRPTHLESGTTRLDTQNVIAEGGQSEMTDPAVTARKFTIAAIEEDALNNNFFSPN